MATARVFRSGNSQALRLPKEFRRKSKEAEIFHRGDELVIREKPGTLEAAFHLLAGLPKISKFLIEPRTIHKAQGALIDALLDTNLCIYILQNKPDLWIAAHALAAGLTLVTNTEKEFRRVRGLKTQNWIA